MINYQEIITKFALKSYKVDFMKVSGAPTHHNQTSRRSTRLPSCWSVTQGF